MAMLSLGEAHCAWVTGTLQGMAQHHATGRVASILEGGCGLQALERSIVAQRQATVSLSFFPLSPGALVPAPQLPHRGGIDRGEEPKRIPRRGSRQRSIFGETLHEPNNLFIRVILMAAWRGRVVGAV
jgi:hypothetical protein